MKLSLAETDESAPMELSLAETAKSALETAKSAPMEETAKSAPMEGTAKSRLHWASYTIEPVAKPNTSTKR